MSSNGTSNEASRMNALVMVGLMIIAALVIPAVSATGDGYVVDSNTFDTNNHSSATISLDLASDGTAIIPTWTGYNFSYVGTPNSPIQITGSPSTPNPKFNIVDVESSSTYAIIMIGTFSDLLRQNPLTLIATPPTPIYDVNLTPGQIDFNSEGVDVTIGVPSTRLGTVHTSYGLGLNNSSVGYDVAGPEGTWYVNGDVVASGTATVYSTGAELRLVPYNESRSPVTWASPKWANKTNFEDQYNSDIRISISSNSSASITTMITSTTGVAAEVMLDPAMVIEFSSSKPGFDYSEVDQGELERCSDYLTFCGLRDTPNDSGDGWVIDYRIDESLIYGEAGGYDTANLTIQMQGITSQCTYAKLDYWELTPDEFDTLVTPRWGDDDVVWPLSTPNSITLSTNGGTWCYTSADSIQIPLNDLASDSRKSPSESEHYDSSNGNYDLIVMIRVKYITESDGLGIFYPSWFKDSFDITLDWIGHDNAPCNEASFNQTDSTSLDNYVSSNSITKVDFIKMDIEGAETDAIIGAKKILKKYKPKLAISIYHKPDDFWSIPLLIKDINTDYKFMFAHHSPIQWESVIYAY